MNVLKMALRNLMHRRVRTVFMIVFVMILTGTLFISDHLVSSMSTCIDTTVNRMGADVIVTSKEYADELGESLFQGEICAFYIDKDVLDEVTKLNGIEKISPQMYIGSLAAACCAAPVQIIAIDPETDFIVQPWLSKLGMKELGDGEVLTGAGVSAVDGGSIKFFDKDFHVAGKLERTRTGYDNCVFMNFNTAYTLFESEKLQETSGVMDPTKVISTIMIRTKDDVSVTDVTREINYHLPVDGIKAFSAKGMFENISNTMNQIKKYSSLMIIIMIIMAMLALICIYNITINERMREFGILLSVGMKKSKILRMLIYEAILIGIVGGIAGVVLSGGGLFLFNDVIVRKMQIPYLILDISYSLKVSLMCLLLGTVVSILSTSYATFKMGRLEPYRMIQEVES